MAAVARLLLVLALWGPAAPLISSLAPQPDDCCAQEHEREPQDCPCSACPCCPLRPALAQTATAVPAPLTVERPEPFSVIHFPVLDGAPRKVFHPPKSA